MKNIIFCILLNFLNLFSFSQEIKFIPVDSVKIINEEIEIGGYLDFDEFRNNTPSIKMKFALKDKSASAQGQMVLNSQLTAGPVNKLKYFDETTGKLKVYRGKIWGFYDGKKLYVKLFSTLNKNANRPINANINYENHMYSNGDFFHLKNIGKYCIYEFQGYKNINGMSTPYEALRIIDIETGKLLKLKNGTLKKILSEEPDLLEDFKNERFKEMYLDDYIIKYNKRKGKNKRV